MKPLQTGICILVLDSDRSSAERTILLLASCQYKVIPAERATEALSILSESRCKIDIVLTEFDLPDMNGLELIEKVLKIRSLPVIFLSTFVNNGAKIQCMLKGARFCYDKPLLEYPAKNLWQSCVPKRNPSANSEIPGKIWDKPGSRNANMHLDNLILETRKGFVADNCLMIPMRREMSYTPEELHQKFVLAVNYIGFYAAQPKRILELMNVPGLTIENVANHLQRYRLHMMQKADGNDGLLNMNPSPSMGVGCNNIYNELDRKVKLEYEENHQIGLQTSNLEPNIANHLQRSHLHMKQKADENDGLLNMHSEQRNMNLSPSMGVGCNIYNELGREVKLEYEEIPQIGLQTSNLEPNVAETSGGGYGNRNNAGNRRKILARGRMPSANIMNAAAYKKK